MSTYRALDGGVVQIEGSKISPRDDATRFAVFEGSGRQLEFALGPPGYGEWVASEEAVDLTESYALPSGADLKLGFQATTDPVTKLSARYVLGVWNNDRWSMTAWLFGADAQQMIDLYNEFVITEDSSGLVLTPRPGSELALSRRSGRAPEVDTYIDGLGSIEVLQRTAEQSGLVPRTPGLSLEGGQLWIEDIHDSQLTALLHVSDSAITRVYPERAPESELIERCADLRVTWLDAGRA